MQLNRGAIKEEGPVGGGGVKVQVEDTLLFMYWYGMHSYNEY